MKSMLTRPFVTAACLALAATLSGCGGGGDGNTRMDTDTEMTGGTDTDTGMTGGTDTDTDTGMTGGTDTDTGQGDLFSMIDLGDWDNSAWISPLGASGHPGSPHYSDQTPIWADIQLVPMLYDWGRIEKGKRQGLGSGV